MNRETSHSMFNLRREYFGFRNNFLACFGPGASSIMEIFLISLTARFVSSNSPARRKYSLLDLFLSFQQMEVTPEEALSENIFRSGCMIEHSARARVVWREIVTLWDIIYYFLLICSESKGGFPGWTTVDQSYLTKHCNRKDKNEIISSQIGICAIW